jgi:hypothetical protein
LITPHTEYMVSNIALPSESQIARSVYLFGYQSTTDRQQLLQSSYSSNS